MNGKPQRYAVVGMQHRKAEGLVASLPPDNPMVLVREPDNKFDPNAVQVWARGRHVGYIPKNQNAVLAKFIDDNGAPFPVAAGGSGMGLDTQSAFAPKSVAARLHLGSNTYPLVEVA